MVSIGPHEIGGALYVNKKSDDTMYDLQCAGNISTIASQLRVGDTVDRMLANGDLVVMNRQPYVFCMIVL